MLQEIKPVTFKLWESQSVTVPRRSGNVRFYSVCVCVCAEGRTGVKTTLRRLVMTRGKANENNRNHLRFVLTVRISSGSGWVEEGLNNGHTSTTVSLMVIQRLPAWAIVGIQSILLYIYSASQAALTYTYVVTVTVYKQFIVDRCIFKTCLKIETLQLNQTKQQKTTLT